MEEKITLPRVVWGLWRIASWNKTPQELAKMMNMLLDIGVDTVDLADIYGDYAATKLFGEVLKADPTLSKRIQIVTKADIVLLSEKHPEVYVQHYDTSAEHIIASVEQSLQDLGRDYIDLLLIHRPDPFMDPLEVSQAFDELYNEGKVHAFGVSNFMPYHHSLLSKYTKQPLLVNQIEISLMHPNPFLDSQIPYMMENDITPMAWSPTGGGRLFTSEEQKAINLRLALGVIAHNHNATAEQIAYAWLLNHPSNIVVVAGSSNFKRVKAAVEAEDILLDRQEWFYLLQQATGESVP
ncbi:aldo/keto reductase [Coprothermobacter platensis]|uniref:aldo/keto reductase n=1 Tax=Coprothermobacter platensis TaxID=108819 RepID=UPI0003738A43|nr:aldo/keto reductase [Coprothermobacter platensis]